MSVHLRPLSIINVQKQPSEYHKQIIMITLRLAFHKSLNILCTKNKPLIDIDKDVSNIRSEHYEVEVASKSWFLTHLQLPTITNLARK